MEKENENPENSIFPCYNERQKLLESNKEEKNKREDILHDSELGEKNRNSGRLELDPIYEKLSEL